MNCKMLFCFLVVVTQAVQCLLTGASLSAAERYGGIEIGAKGVKWVVLDIDQDNKTNPIATVASGDVNTTLAQLNGKSFAPDAIAETIQAIELFLQKMTDATGELKVQRGRIFVVASSGLPKADNLADLEKLVTARTGKELAFLNVDDEVRLSIKGLSQQRDAEKALYLDIGSGNTKGGFLASGKVVRVELPGTVTFTTEVERLSKQGGKELAAAAQDARKSFLVPKLREQMDAGGEMKRRDPVYLNGGLAWALATIVHPDKYNLADVPLDSLDIEDFRERLAIKPGAFPDVDQRALPADAVKEIQRVRGVFTPDNLVAGAELLKALDEALGFKGRKVYFVRNGRVAWLVGYVSEKVILPKNPIPPGGAAKTQNDPGSNKPAIVNTAVAPVTSQCWVPCYSSCECVCGRRRWSHGYRLCNSVPIAASGYQPVGCGFAMSYSNPYAGSVQTTQQATVNAPTAEPLLKAAEPKAEELVKPSVFQVAAIRTSQAIQYDPEDVATLAQRAVSEIAAGNKGQAQLTIIRLRRLLNGDRQQRSQMYRSLERVQGPVRVEFESMLALAR
jgi:Ppx/GppA phosphatase family protein